MLGDSIRKAGLQVTFGLGKVYKVAERMKSAAPPRMRCGAFSTLSDIFNGESKYEKL